jgi:DNA invertase Pin-like site-specific DNA recombinase
MNAAIYTRKSTEQHGVATDATSVGRQEAGARQFIAAKGWALDDAHIYKDDGKSGALFANRAEFQRMMRDAAAGAFDVVVLFDLDRFGRHTQKSMEALYALSEAGVDVYDFSTGQKVDLDSFEGEFITNFKTGMAQQFREQIRKHTKAAMRRKAEQGWATSGKVFGYDNVRIGKGHAERRVNEQEALVVRDIYTRFAMGEGARTIAGALNRAGVPKPRAQQGKRDGWSVSTIRAVLRRPLYRGELVYGRTAKAYNRELKKVYRGTKREKGQIPKPEDTWIRRDVPALRIIEPALAAKVDARWQDRRTRYLASKARNHGLKKGDRTAPEKATGRYLLSGGMLLCPTCGGNFEARKHPWRRRGNETYEHYGNVYICSTRRRKPGVCPNTLALPIAETDDTVLSIIEGEVLGTRFISQLLALVQHAPDETVWLAAERDRLQTEVDRLVGSIAAGVPADTVAPLIRTNHAAIGKLDARLRVPSQPRLDAERLQAALEQRAAQWKADLRAEPHVARLVLRRLVGPLTLWDESERPDFIRWEATPTAELLDGLATLEGTSPAGFEPAFWP